MDLFDVVRSCIRRWYIVLPLLLIVAGFSYHMYSSVKPIYYTSAVISIAPPNTRLDQAELGVPVPRNGLLDVGGPTLLANLVVFGLRNPSVVAQVVAAGGRPDYTARIFPAAAGAPELPLIFIEATESDPIAASKTVESVVAQTGPVFQAMQQQAGVPDDQMVNALTVSPPGTPVSGTPSRTRATVAIFAAGFGMAILIGVLFDFLIVRRKDRRQKPQPTPISPPTDRVGGAGGNGTAPRAGNLRPRRVHVPDGVPIGS